MSHELDMAAGIPLPKSVMGTPAQSPYTPAARSWLNEPFSASPEPQALRLSSIEVVPPTPPPRTGRKKLPRDVPVRINEEGIIVMGEESVSSPMSPSYTIGSPYATPRNLKMSMNTPTATPRQRVMNRMSRTFHAGTPPPAIRMLHPDDATRHAPISATFVRDPNNKRSSIISMSNQSNKRQSVFSVQGASALQHELERQQRHQQDRDQRHGKRPRMDHKETGTSETLSPEMARGERSRSHSQQSHATSGGHTWHTSDSSGSNQDSTVPAKMMRVDPLTVLERRRRRDFTIGSHNPLHGPPNTPNETPRRGVSMAESDLSEVPEVGWRDVMGRFKSVVRRFSDMPWVAEPCVATLVIPVGPNEKRCAGGMGGMQNVETWYKKKPSLDELLQAGTVDDDMLQTEPPTANTFATLMTPTIRDEDLDGASTTTETIASPPMLSSPPLLSPESGVKSIAPSVFSPRTPEPAHSMGRERFGDALVVRGLVNRP